MKGGSQQTTKKQEQETNLKNQVAALNGDHGKEAQQLAESRVDEGKRLYAEAMARSQRRLPPPTQEQEDQRNANQARRAQEAAMARAREATEVQTEMLEAEAMALEAAKVVEE